MGLFDKLKDSIHDSIHNHDQLLNGQYKALSNEEGQYALFDSKGNRVSDYYDDVERYSDQYVRAYDDNKGSFALMDSTGEIVVGWFAEINVMDNGLFMVYDDEKEKYAIANKHGVIVSKWEDDEDELDINKCSQISSLNENEDEKEIIDNVEIKEIATPKKEEKHIPIEPETQQEMEKDIKEHLQEQSQIPVQQAQHVVQPTHSNVNTQTPQIENNQNYENMYNKQLEQLINAALADGQLTEKEKQILYKKAQSFGIDLDEFEMVLDARLVEIEKAEKEKSAQSAPKSNKLGDIRKCPACGALLPTLATFCPDCGYEISGINAVMSRQKFLDGLLMYTKDSLMASMTNFKAWNYIKTFPVPNTKADLFDFIAFLQANVKDQEFGTLYSQKLDECVAKAKLLFPNDQQMQPMIQMATKEKKDVKKKRILTFVAVVGGFLLFSILCFILAAVLDR